MTDMIVGKFVNGKLRVWIDGKELLPKESQKVYNHSPDGFNIGYNGSGPGQLALALCLHFLHDEVKTIAVYQTFKRKVVAMLPQGENFEISMEFVEDEIKELVKSARSSKEERNG